MTKPSIDRIIRDSRDGCLVLSQGEALAMVKEIERLRAALKTAHDVFAAEIEGLHKIILMNQPDYKRTVVASVDGL